MSYPPGPDAVGRGNEARSPRRLDVAPPPVPGYTRTISASSAPLDPQDCLARARLCRRASVVTFCLIAQQPDVPTYSSAGSDALAGRLVDLQAYCVAGNCRSRSKPTPVQSRSHRTERSTCPALTIARSGDDDMHNAAPAQLMPARARCCSRFVSERPNASHRGPAACRTDTVLRWPTLLPDRVWRKAIVQDVLGRQEPFSRTTQPCVLVAASHTCTAGGSGLHICPPATM